MARIIDVKSRKGTCSIHGEELIETHPADAENGPSPDDVLNELVCPACVSVHLMVRETFVNITEGYRYGDSEWQESFTDDLGALYRNAAREYGRCTSKVYEDRGNGKAAQVGWCFLKRVDYADAHRIKDPAKRTYLREVWIEYKEAR